MTGVDKRPGCDTGMALGVFLLRVLFGAAIINSTVSAWVSLTVVALSFYLGLGKRRNELKNARLPGRQGRSWALIPMSFWINSCIFA